MAAPGELAPRAAQGRVPAALLVLAIAIFGVQAVRLSAEGPIPLRELPRVFMQNSGVLLLVTAVGVVAVGLTAFMTRRRPRLGSLVCVLLAVVVLAITPVSVAYDDGCNRHVATVPGLAVVPVLVAKPEAPDFVYSDGQTLAGCRTLP